MSKPYRRKLTESEKLDIALLFLLAAPCLGVALALLFH